MSFPIARKTRREVQCFGEDCKSPSTNCPLLLEYARILATWTQKYVGKELLTCIQVSTTNKNGALSLGNTPSRPIEQSLETLHFP